MQSNMVVHGNADHVMHRTAMSGTMTRSGDQWTQSSAGRLFWQIVQSQSGGWRGSWSHLTRTWLGNVVFNVCLGSNLAIDLFHHLFTTSVFQRKVLVLTAYRYALTSPCWRMMNHHKKQIHRSRWTITKTTRVKFLSCLSTGCMSPAI